MKMISTMIAPATIAVTICASACGTRPAVATAPTSPRGIEAAGLPYAILDAHTGRQVDEGEFWTRAANAQVVCLGEEHKNPHHHWAQLRALEELLKQPSWTAPGLGMEMFQRPFQGVLDDYAAGRIDDSTLKSRTSWDDRWSYDFGFYRPQMQRVVVAKGALLALNAARELTKKVVRQGLESLTIEEKAMVPELNLTDAEHRAWFDGVMAEMSDDDGAQKAHGPASLGTTTPTPTATPATPTATPTATPATPTATPATPTATPAAAPSGPAMPSMDRVYTVQVMWDESMADGAARWLSADPARHLAILAGAGHCHDSAIVRRVKRRGVSSAISIRPMLDLGDGELATALAKPQNDYLFVMTMPSKSSK